MSTKQSMDLFGEALLAYSRGDKSKFFLKTDSGKEQYSLSERFRSYSKLNKSEKKLIALCHGTILDVGCGTGNIIPALEKKGKVLGIDISEKVIAAANRKNCITADIFSFSTKQKFDTITLFGNNFGIGGTVRNTKKLLQILKTLLKPKGQILAIARNYDATDYKELSLTPIWKNRVGKNFAWLIFSISFLSKLCKEQKLNLTIISKSNKYSVIRITK
jgi:SAM-dependent methyltransferase